MTVPLRRITALLTLFFFCFAVLSPPLLAAQSGSSGPVNDAGAASKATASDEPSSVGGKALKWIKEYPSRYIRRIRFNEDKLASPEELEKRWGKVSAKTFDGNESVREAESSILRPVKQVGLNVMDEQIKTVRQFLAFQSAQFLYKYGTPAFKETWSKAGKVVAAIGKTKAGPVSKSLMAGPFGQGLRKVLSSGNLKSFAAQEGNFAMMAVISVLISSGIYDGMQVDEFKDHAIAIGAFAAQHSYGRAIPGAIINSFLSRHMYTAFQNSFDRLYGQALASRSTWSVALSKANVTSEAFGAKMLATNRKGISAAAAGKSGDFGKKLGLVGVGEGAKFSVKTLMQRAFVGGSFALVGDFVVEGATAIIQGHPDKLYLGGDRNKYYARPDTNTYRFQRTGNPIKDWIRERSRILESLWDNRLKWPLQSIIRPVSTFVGGYIGSVAAGALFAGGAGALLGGTLISAALAGIGMFFGSWIGSKLDRSALMMKFRRGNYERTIKKEIREMLAYEHGTITDEEADRLAKLRALDFEKCEKIGQTPNRMFIVDKLENVLVFKDGDYIKFSIPDKNGKRVTKIGHTKYDIIDLEGRRGIFDIEQAKIVDVGKVAENSGRSIIFVNGGRATVDQGILTNSKTSPLHIFPNGVILEWREYRDGKSTAGDDAKRHEAPEGRKDDQTGEWIARGHAATEDLFFRDTGERFTFENGQFSKVTANPNSAAPQPKRSVNGFDPLKAYRKVLDESPDEENLKLGIIRQAQLSADRARASLEMRLVKLGSAEDVEAFIRSVRLQESDPKLTAQLRETAREDVERAQMFLRGRVDSFVSRLGRTLGQSLQDASEDQLKQSFVLATETPAASGLQDTGEPYVTVLRTMEKSPFWGLLGLTATPDILGQAVFDPEFMKPVKE